jgi:hypothetical protein
MMHIPPLTLMAFFLGVLIGISCGMLFAQCELQHVARSPRTVQQEGIRP